KVVLSDQVVTVAHGAGDRVVHGQEPYVRLAADHAGGNLPEGRHAERLVGHAQAREMVGERDARVRAVDTLECRDDRHRCWGSAGSITQNPGIGSGAPWITSEQAYHRAYRRQAFDRVRNRRLAAVPLEVGEKDVFPQLVAAWPRFDSRQVDALLLEDL